jgi:hypothetical protein
MTTQEHDTGANTQFAQLAPSQIAAMVADAQGWKPEDGDEIEGTVLAVKQAWSDVKNSNYPIVFIMRDSGEVVGVHCFQTVLFNEMLSARPAPGERLYVKRIGVDESKDVKKGQSPTIRYAVYVQREGTNDPWAHMDLHNTQRG